MSKQTNKRNQKKQSQALFFLLVWFVPFALFISLSVNDNVLPSSSFSIGHGYFPSSTASIGTSDRPRIDTDTHACFAHARPRRPILIHPSIHSSCADTSLGSSSGSLYGGYSSDTTTAATHAGSSPYKGGRPNKALQKKGGIRGLLDTVNSRIAPGIAKSV